MSDNRPFICSAGNVDVPSYLVLCAMGYTVSAGAPSGAPVWYAENEQRRCGADSLVELLGLVCMLEARGNDWQATDSEIDTFLHSFPP